MQKKYDIGRTYCLKSPHTNNVYIGSTFQPLHKRFYKHKNDHKRYLNGSFNFISSFDIIEAGDCYIELINEYRNLNKNQLEKMEGEEIKNNKDCVNIRRIGRSRKEYYEDNYEKIINYRAKYHEENKEKIKKQKKEHREKNNQKIQCECGSVYSLYKKNDHFKTKKHKNFLGLEN